MSELVVVNPMQPGVTDIDPCMRLVRHAYPEAMIVFRESGEKTVEALDFFKEIEGPPLVEEVDAVVLNPDGPDISCHRIICAGKN